MIRAWPIHRQHSPSRPIVGQSELSANDDNRWPVRADVSRWCYSLNSPSHGLYRPPVQSYSRFHAASVFDCSSSEEGIYLWRGQANNQCSTVQALRGVICVWSSCSSTTLLDQQSLSQALIKCGNKTLLALLPTASIDKAFLVIGIQFSIGKMIKGRHNSITLCPIDRTDYHFSNWWV